MKNVIILLAIKVMVLGCVSLSLPVFAGDKKAGELKASSCVACHGAKGVSVNPLWPSLAGQKEAYLVKQMTDFREGRRKDPLMAPMAQSLSDTDIKDLAAYFSSL
jgi:cytochrome c553